MEPEIRGPPKASRPVATARGGSGAARKGSVTASFGSLFVFDTCKPSDLRNALEEMEPEESFNGARGDQTTFGADHPVYGEQMAPNSASPDAFGSNSFNSFEFGTFDTYVPVAGSIDGVSSNSGSFEGASVDSSSPFDSNGTSTPKSVEEADEFAYADEQLDAIIDMLDLSVLMEDDRGMTDWMDDEALSAFEFAPEWLEMTITMKESREGGQEVASGVVPDSGLRALELASPTRAPAFDEVEALFASKRKEAAEAASHHALSNQTNRFSPSSSPPTSVSGSGSRSNPSSTKIPLNRSIPPTGVVPGTTSSTTPPTSSPPEVQGGPRKVSQLQRSISHQVTTATNPVAFGAPHAALSAPINMPPPQALPPVPLGQPPIFTQRAIPPTGALPPVPLVPGSTASPPSSFILPKAFVPPTMATSPKVSPGQSPLASGTPLSQSPSPGSTSQLASFGTNAFQSPLLVAPGLGEKTITIGAAIYRMNRMMDPSAPFESILHDKDALHPTPLVTVSAPVAIPPSAGTNQQSPPSFTVNVVIIGQPSDGIETLGGIGKSAADFLMSSQLDMANLSLNPSSNDGSNSSLPAAARPQPAGAPLVVSRNKQNAQASSSPSGAQSSFTELQLTSAINYPNIPGKVSSQVPHVLVATLAVLNQQGRTKRVVKLIAIAMTPSDAVPSIPTTAASSGELRRPTAFQGDPTTLSLVSAISSSNGAIFVLPRPVTASSTAGANPATDFDVMQATENINATFKVFQRLNYHSGPIKGNPHVRLLTFPREYNPVDGTSGENSVGSSQADFIYETAISWAKTQSINMMRMLSSENWLQEWQQKVGGVVPQWFLNPIIAHVSAQCHVLRMEALMTSFDRALHLERETSKKTSALQKSPPTTKGSNTPIPAKPTTAQRQTVGGKPNSPAPIGTVSQRPIIMGLPIGVAPPAPLASAASSGASPSASSPSRTSLSSSNKIKRTIAVIGLPGSGRSSVIKRACHARTSKLLPGESSMMSTVMMSTMSPLTSTLVGGGAAPGGQISSSSFADVYFNTSRCLMEFVETPVRALNKIQFYKDINRAHAYIFVYSGVHPSPQDIQDMHLALLDILAAKAQANELKKSGPSAPSTAFGIGPKAGGAPSSRKNSTFSLNDVPIILLGTQAPINPEMSLANLLKAREGLDAFDSSTDVAADPSMMSLQQLLQQHRLAHFAVDTAPLHNSELGRALQWLYNRIGEDTLQLKGIRATNRPHHSGSISVVRPVPGTGPVGGQSKPFALPPRTPTPANPSTLGNSSSQNPLRGPQGNGPLGGSGMASSSQLQSGAATQQRNARAPNAAQDPNSSAALFIKIETLVMSMRGAPGSGTHSWALPIQDRRFDNGLWVTIPNSASGASSSSAGGSSSNSQVSIASYDDESSSSSKKKILIKCFSGTEAVDWTVEHVVKPEKAAANAGASSAASGSYVTSPSQLRSEALAHLQQLLDVSVIRCVHGGSDNAKFLDSGDALYRFQMDEDNDSILNTRKVWIGDVDHVEIEQLAAWLFQKIQPFIVPSDGNGNPIGGLHIGAVNGLAGGAGGLSSSGSGFVGNGMSPSSSSGSLTSSSSNPSLSTNSASSSGDYGALSASRPFVIDGEAFKASSLWNELLLFSAKLQKVSLKKMSHAQKLAFWINVYNILSVHVNIQHGHVGKSKTKRKLLYSKTFYQIDGLVYSLDDILHGILRGNRKNPNTSKYPFKPADPRRKNVLHHDSLSNLNPNLYASAAGGSSVGSNTPWPLDPRIHFALTTLTKSSPFIVAMKWDTLDAQLDALARQILAIDLEVNFKNSVVVLPPSVHNFKADFAKASQPLMSFLSRFLDNEKSKNLAFLANKIKDKDVKSKSEDTTPSAPRIRTSA